MLRVFKHYWPSVRKFRHWCILTLMAMTAGVLADAAYPFLLRSIVNEVSKPQGSSAMVWKMFFYIAGLYVLQNIAWRLFDVGIVQFEARTMRDLDKRSFAALQRQSIDFFASNFSGSLVKKVTQFRSAFEGMADIGLFQYGKNLILILCIMFIFAREMPLLALILAIWLVIFILINVSLARWKYSMDMRVSESDSAISGYLADSLGTHAVVKNWGMESAEQMRLEASLNDNFRKRTKAWNRNSLINCIQGLLMASVELTVLWLLIGKWEQGTISVGDFVFFNSYVLWLFAELWSFGNSLRRWFFYSADAEKMCDVFEQHTEVTEAPHAKPLIVQHGAITFNKVDFVYPGAQVDQGALHQITLQIAAGQSVGLVGESGSGKSTLAKVLMRYYALTGGSITIDDQDIAKTTLQSVRQAIGFVPQEAEMFHRSLLENIRFGKQDATETEVIAAAQHAHAWEFITKLPDGLQTVVGERGLKLSGGQRQRIALARAFLVNAPILVLDEATSALDSETESYIQAAIGDLIMNRTSLVIAHRLSTIMRLDRIIVLHKGRIAEQGTHAELLRLKGKYAKLWSTQTGDYIE